MNSRLAAILLFVSVALPSRAHADAAADQARDHYTAGTRLFDLTHYDEAIVEFEAGYKARADAVFLYNIAQAHRLAGHLEKAARFYRNYLRADPTSSERKKIEDRIAEIERTLESAHQQQTSPPAGTHPPPSGEPRASQPSPAGEPPPQAQSPTVRPAPAAATLSVASKPASESARPLVRAGLALLASGVLVGLGGGVGFGLGAQSQADAITRESADQVMYEPSVDASRKLFVNLSIGAAVVGAVVAVAGGALVLVGTRGGAR